MKLKELAFNGRDWVMAHTDEELCIILTYFPDGRVVALRQQRPAFNGWVIGPPMGTFPPAPPEELMRIAAREAEDETGYPVEDIDYCFSVGRSPGLTNQQAHVYIARLRLEKVGQKLHPDERILVVDFPAGSTAREALSAFPHDEVDAAFWYFFLPHAELRG